MSEYSKAKLKTFILCILILLFYL